MTSKIMKKTFAIGIDIGGSHITSQLFNLENNSPLVETKIRMTMINQNSKNEILETWSECIKKSCFGYGFEKIAGIGFAMPGPFDYPGGIAWFKGVNKFENLFGVDVRNEMIKKLDLDQNFPIRFYNDASCFAIGETWMGEASAYKRVVALTLGTGFGSTFMEDGFPVGKSEGVPYEGFLYNIPYKESIADDYFSTRWFLKEYKEKTGAEISDVKELAQTTGSDTVSLKLFRIFGENLGDFLTPWVRSFNAECVVLGGNISKSHVYFLDAVKEVFVKDGLETTILLSKLNETAALLGSARLCDDVFYSQLMNL